MYYGARYYLPGLRRFISADTIVPGAGNPQNLNRYSYVVNNPIRFVDPSGHVPTVLIGAAIGAIAGGAVHAIASGDDFDWGEFGIAVLAGTAAGALAGTGIGLAASAPVAATILTGAGVGAGAAQFGYTVTTDNYDSREMAVAWGVGAVSGAITSGVGRTSLTPSQITGARILTSGAASATQYALTQQVRGEEVDAEDLAWAGYSGCWSGLAAEAARQIFPSTFPRISDSDRFRSTWSNLLAAEPALQRELMASSAAQSLDEAIIGAGEAMTNRVVRPVATWTWEQVEEMRPSSSPPTSQGTQSQVPASSPTQQTSTVNYGIGSYRRYAY